MVESNDLQLGKFGQIFFSPKTYGIYTFIVRVRLSPDVKERTPLKINYSLREDLNIPSKFTSVVEYAGVRKLCQSSLCLDVYYKNLPVIVLATVTLGILNPKP